VAHYLEVPLDDGTTVLADVTTTVEGTSLAGGREVIGRMSQTLERALDRLEPFTLAIVQRLSKLPMRPSRASVQFGISLTAKAGVIIAESTGQSHLTITLEWEPPRMASSPNDPAD
jgi:hypothetical protein